MSANNRIDNPITITIGHEQLLSRRRNEVLSIANDFLIAIWFFTGSVFFLYPDLQRDGVWLFIISSFQFLIRPTIRLAGYMHLRRIPSSHWES